MNTRLQLTPLDYMEVVRVAVSNNFNCTPKEYKQLDEYAKKNPHKYFFINSNIRTPSLLNINNHPYKVVLTANPDLKVDWKLIERLYELDPEKIAFTRVKWLPRNEEIKNLALELSMAGYPVVITMQRFNGRASLRKYTELEYYKWSHNRFRLHGVDLKALEKLVDDNARMYICDRKGLGCGGCGLCAKLSLGSTDVRISSLNLSSSGICKYNCPDCYAKTMSHFAVSCGHTPVKFDSIKQNSKQAGKTKHIIDTKEALDVSNKGT